jgi:hypothetical protein
MFNGSALARGEGLPQPEKNSLTNPCFIDGVTEEQMKDMLLFLHMQ